MGRRRRTREGLLLAALIQAPWQLSVVIGVVTFILLRWTLPSVGANNMFFNPIAIAFANFAWLVAAAFFLVGAVAYLRTAAARRTRPSAMLRKDSQGKASEWRRPRWAPQTSDGRIAPSANPDMTAWGPLDKPRDAATGVTWGPLGEPREVPAGAGRKPAEWSIAVIREIEWKRFEDVCQKYYEAKGIKSATTPLGPDGGIDIRLYQDNTGKASSIVQCKAWGDRFVGVKPVRELLGVMVHEKIEKAFFMTSGRFTDEAKEIATSHRITLIDGEMFLMMLKRLPETARDELLSFATSGDYQTPTCPKCGIMMKQVAGKAGRHDFWGCGTYPKCRQTLPVRRKA